MYISDISVPGTAGNDLLVADQTFASILEGFDGNDTLYGGAGDDTLYGGAGNDELNGGAGNNLLVGGTGDDFYVVNSLGDQVVEQAGEGVDRVLLLANDKYILTDNVEQLFLAGNATFGAGNSADNFLVANQNLGSTLYGDDGNDVIMGGGGADTLYGDAGNDHLNGGAGADSLVGGTGDDYYVVDNTLDQVVEAPGGGVDSVASTVKYTLSDNVENLFLGGGATVGTGNNGDNYMVANQTLASTLNGLDGNDYLIGGAGNDTINGGAGNDYLDGGAGNDTLYGGAGNDYYVIDSWRDQIVEAPRGGVDSVYLLATGNYYLPTNVENVYLGGNATTARDNSHTNNYMAANQTLDSVLSGAYGNDTLIGGAGNDFLDGGQDNDLIVGGAGNDRLVGLIGNDTLIGGAGNDTFVMPTLGTGDVYIITDFTSGQDKMELYSGILSELTPSNLAFETVTSDQQAATSSANIVYNSTSGSLFYNQDGTTDGFGAGGQFASLTPNLTLTASDFVFASSF